MFDNNLFFRTGGAGSLTSTETSGAITLTETPIDGLALLVQVPKQSAGDTMQVTLQHSTDGTTYTTLLALDTVASTTVTTTPAALLGPYRFATRLKYVRTVTTVAGTTPDYGAVQIFLGDRDWANNYKFGAGTATSVA